jgi:hypothetical protein
VWQQLEEEVWQLLDVAWLLLGVSPRRDMEFTCRLLGEPMLRGKIELLV